MKKNKITQLITILFYIVLIAFIFSYTNKLDFDTLTGVQISYGYVLLSSLFLILNKFFNSYVWMKILVNLGAEIKDFFELNYVYAKSWLGRYIPGKVTWLLGRIYFASKHGISKKKLGVSSLLEAILQVFSGLLYGGLLLFCTNGLEIIDSKMRIFILFFCLCICIFLIPPVFNKILKMAYWVFKKKTLESEHLINWSIILKSILYFSLSTTFSGIAFFTLNYAIYKIPISKVPYYIGAMNIASSIGIASLFAPSGLGVKEGLLVLFFNEIMPPEVVLVVVVLSRVWSVIMDFVFWGLSSAILSFRRRL